MTEAELLAAVEAKRNDPEFMGRLEDIIERDADILGALGEEERVRRIAIDTGSRLPRPVERVVFAAVREKVVDEARHEIHGDADAAVRAWVIIDMSETLKQYERERRTAIELIGIVRDQITDSNGSDKSARATARDKIAKGLEIYERTDTRLPEIA